MTKSFLDYLRSLETDDHSMCYVATDDDLPRNFWPGEKELLVRAWKEKAERELCAQLREPRASVELRVPEHAEDALLFT
jgi:hypothetical protein